MKKYKKILIYSLIVIIGVGLIIGTTYFIKKRNKTNEQESYYQIQIESIKEENQEDEENIDSIITTVEEVFEENEDISSYTNITYPEKTNQVKIIGTNSQLVFNNCYEDGTAFNEKVIYMDEVSRNNMEFKGAYAITPNEVVSSGDFEGSYIDIKYGDIESSYLAAITRLKRKEFGKYKRKQFYVAKYDANSNEQYVAKTGDKEETITLEEGQIDEVICGLLDLSNGDEQYILGYYCKKVDEQNYLVINIVLDKSSNYFDITSKSEFEKFWIYYEDYYTLSYSQGETDFVDVDVRGKTYIMRYKEDTYAGEYNIERYETLTDIETNEVLTYE